MRIIFSVLLVLLMPSAGVNAASFYPSEPELLRSVEKTLDPESRIFAKFKVENDFVYFVESEQGYVSMIAAGKKAAHALTVMKQLYKYSDLEIFEALGGRREDALPDLFSGHIEKYGEKLKIRPYPSIPTILEGEVVIYGNGTECNPDQNPCDDSDGYVKVGLLATATNICEEGFGFDDWENFLGSEIFYPWASSHVSDALDNLGTYGQFGKGVWTNGNANITIPATYAGGIVVCSRNFSGSGPTLIVQEELFPGAWFHHYEEHYILSGYVYGIVFDGSIMHHRTRVLIRNFESEDVGDDNVFWWAAGF